MNAKYRDLSGDAKGPVGTRAAYSKQPHQVFRSDTRWGRSVIEWPSLEVFLATPQVQSGVHSVPIGEFSGKQVNYDFFLTARPGTVLLCHFHGNAPREGSELPIFTGLGVTSSITTSMFVPSDPILALDASLSLAWHFGCEGISLQAITVHIVQKLQTLLHAPRVVAWGGSGGGFAAIRVAKDVPNAIALVWNPQTNIAKYAPQFVNRYRRIAFPSLAGNGSFPSDREQFPSLCTDEFGDGYQGRILYLQERTDEHVNDHLRPFLARFCREASRETTGFSKFSGFVTDQLYLHLVHWGIGHVPPSKDILAKLLSLLSDVAINLENLESLACFPNEVMEIPAANVSQDALATKISEKFGSGPLGSSSNNESPPDLKEILAIPMDQIEDDFGPFDVTLNCSGDTVALPLYTDELVEVSLFQGVQWDRKFATQANSSVMQLFSLNLVGRLLSTFQMRNDADALRLAVVVLESFLAYSNEPISQLAIGRIPSGDHSAATRVRVFIKFIQVMRERQDADYALLKKVCDCLKYWSDWLANPVNYKANNHGLMGSISLLHSAVQFGTTPYASRYREVATNRILELSKSSFDKDGLCDENSIGYHNFNLRLYRGLLGFCKHYGISETLISFLEDVILRATKALEFCVWQDSSIPPIGDLAVCRVSLPSRNESRCFYESGFAVVKNDDFYLSILCGARTEIHKQVDDTSMTLRFMNRDILVDGGSYLYDRTNRHRRCIESSLGHSGLFLKEFDGLLRSEFLKKFGPVAGKIERFEESDEGVRVKCVYSVINGHAVFVRHIFVCWPDEVAIVDSVEHSEVPGGSETVQRFLFGPTLDVRFDERNKLILTSDDFSCTLFQLQDCDSDLYRGEDASQVRGWCSYKYKEILPTYGVDFMQKAQVSQFATIIKLAKCVSLSECSTAVRAFAGGVDPFVEHSIKNLLHSTTVPDSPQDMKEILAIQMDHIADDFLPFNATVNCSGDRVALPLFTGEIIEVSLSHGVEWERKFATQANSNIMWLFSLAWIGRLLSSFQQRTDGGALQIAVAALNSFLKYSSRPSNQTAIGRIYAGDHSASTRVTVLIKFIQVMRERQDVDYALLEKVCACLKYWSDWLTDPKHYAKHNHGLMGSVALLHSAVQFGTAPHASAYLDVATKRIIELGRNSFDRDGLCNENTIGYHNFNLHLYRGLLKFCKHYGLSAALIQFLEDLIPRAEKALEFCVWQDGSIPPIGDSPVYQSKIVSQNVSRCFPESGFAVVKNDDLYLSIQCGARTETHKHVDDSSMTLRYKNRDILIDGGSYTYDRADPYRRCIESSFGHSGLFLKEFDGLLRGEFRKKFGPVSGKVERFEESDDGVRVKCVYSVNKGRAVFERNIFVCWPDEVAIVDSVALSEVPASFETVQRFLFGPTLDVRIGERNKLILASDDFSCTLFQLLDCNGDLYRGEDASPVRGWFSKKYKEILPTYGVDFVQKAQMSQFATIIKLSKCSTLSECSTSVRTFVSRWTGGNSIEGPKDRAPAERKEV